MTVKEVTAKSGRDNPYFYTFTSFCKENFGRRLYRVPLDIGCTCPNRDGTAGTGGCIFCSEAGSGEYAYPYDGKPLTDEELQKCIGLKSESDRVVEMRRNAEANPLPFIAYFQSFTNTYKAPEELYKLFHAALADDTFTGISVATRPDCMGKEILSIFLRLKKEFPDKFIWIELGLQTMHEKTAKLINRGYTLYVFEKCVNDLKNAGFPVIVHVIIGLPGESKEDIFKTVEYLNELGINGIKLQLLHILKDTRLYEMYCENPASVNVLSLEEYIDIVCGCIMRLSCDVVIHRLTGDGDREKLAAPLWSLDKRRVLNGIMHELKLRKLRV